MQSQYLSKQLRGFPGAPDGIISHEHTWSRLNPAKAQAGTLTVGGTAADGTYSAVFTDPNDPVNVITVSFLRAAGENNAAIAAALNAKALKAFVLRGAPTVVGAVVTIAMSNATVSYTVATSAPTDATLVWAETVAMGGVNIPFGRFVKGGGDGLTMVPLAVGATAAQVLGVLMRELTVAQTREQTEDDYLPPGRDGAVVGVGPMLVECEEAVTPADTVYVRIVASGTKTKIGVVGKSADGGNCISLASYARFDGSAAAGEVVRVISHIPLPPA